MKIIGLEEHWCPSLFYDHPEAPAYQSMRLAKRIVSGADTESMADKVSDIGSSRIAKMDKAGVDIQVLSLCGAIMERIPPELAEGYACESNDILADALRAHPTRLKGLAVVPTQAPEKAALELERCMAMPGFVGLAINGHINGCYLDDPKFTPLLETAQRLSAPIYIHPAVPPASVVSTYYDVGDSYGSEVLATGGFGWHIETAVHVLRLVMSGTFDRFPNLQVIIGHLGEGIPFFINRLALANKGTLQRPAPDYLRQNVSYTTSGFNYPTTFELLLREMGADRIMFSTDYPFLEMDESVKFLENVKVCKTKREKIAHLNAEKLLKL